MPVPQVALIESLIAAERWSEAARALDEVTTPTLDERPYDQPDENWLFNQRRCIIASGALDERRTYAWRLYADHLLAALRRGAVDEALALVVAKAEAGRCICDAAHETGNYHFNTLCVLARAGCTAEAVAAARELVRRGYWGLWRLARDAAGRHWWAEASGQREWLASLENEPSYQAFRGRTSIHLTTCPVRSCPGRSARSTEARWAARRASAAR